MIHHGVRTFWQYGLAIPLHSWPDAHPGASSSRWCSQSVYPKLVIAWFGSNSRLLACPLELLEVSRVPSCLFKVKQESFS